MVSIDIIAMIVHHGLALKEDPQIYKKLSSKSTFIKDKY